MAEHLGPDGAAFGYLLSTWALESGKQYRTRATATLRAETELALTLGQGVEPMAQAAACGDAIAGVAVAIEIVDVGQPPGGDMQEIIAENVYHRAVVFGPTRPVTALPAQASGHIAINGSVRQVGRLREDPARSVLTMARLLAAVGQQLRAGDRLITGSITHVPIQDADVAVAGEGLGSASRPDARGRPA